MNTTALKHDILRRLNELNININVLNFKNLNHRDKALADDILKATGFLQDAAKLRERIYCIEHGIVEQPVCPQCKKNPLKFEKGKYRQFCSIKCLNQSSYHKHACEETTLKHYGVKHHSQSKEFQDRQKQNNLKKYGVEHAFQAQEVIDKCKQTRQEHIDSNPNYWKEREEKSRAAKVQRGHAPNWNNNEKARLTRQDNLKHDPHYYDSANEKESRHALKDMVQR